MFKSIDKPLITTIIPTYRRPKLLRRAILSVLRQTYPNFLIFIYDNASGDDTKAVVKHMMEKDDRIRYHCHSENIGPYNNFNFGMKNVATPYFSLLSDDDFLAPNFYKLTLKGFEEYPEAMFSSSNSIVIDTNQKIISGPTGPEKMTFYKDGDGFEKVVKVLIPNTWTGILFKKEVVDEIGLVDLDAGPFADGGYIWHAAARLPFVAAPDIGAVLMAHDESASKTMMPLSGMWPVWWNQMAKTIEQDEKVPMYIRESVRKVVSPNFKKIGFYQMMQALSKEDIKLADKIARGLIECKYSITAFFLKLLIWSFKTVPLFVIILNHIKQVRRSHIEKTNKALTNEFCRQLAFVNEIMRLLNGIEMQFNNKKSASFTVADNLKQ